MQYDLFYSKLVITAAQDGGAVKRCHRIQKISHILHTGCFEAGVHRQLGKSDIHRRDCHLGLGQIAKRRAAPEVCPVVIILDQHLRLLTNAAEHRR